MTDVQSVLAWLNSNNGAVLAILTLTLVILTGVYVWATLKIARATVDSYKQALDIEKKGNRPYVLFDVQIYRRNRCFFGILQNIGKTPAIDVHVHITPTLLRHEDDPDSELSFAKRPVAFLAPGHKLEDFLSTSPELLNRDSPPAYTVNVAYRDQAGQKYTEELFIDLSHHYDAHSISGDDDIAAVAKHIKTIGAQLGTLLGETRTLNRILGRLTDNSLKNELGSADDLGPVEEEILFTAAQDRNGGRIYEFDRHKTSAEDAARQEAIDTLVIKGYLRSRSTHWELTTSAWNHVSSRSEERLSN